jgi:hypothetical protein
MKREVIDGPHMRRRQRMDWGFPVDEVEVPAARRS